ncbi:hypothetical protein [Burkholderia ubonensis]|uniref:hypothetical protein n=1 Tax=Burkholderia ubonensis TaxID=101571 RepID=UPI0012F8EBC1|nr:hypothetical protein [Burkholderia ubonensis]
MVTASGIAHATARNIDVELDTSGEDMIDLTILIKRIPDLGIAASIFAATLGLVASIVTSRLSFRSKTPELPDPNAKLEDLTRIDEIRESLTRNESIARWAGISNGLLVFGQVVIGGVLATSFVQSQINHAIVSLLGLLVLISSLIHQQFRPDLKNRGARRRVAKLTQLLREAEDGVFEIHLGAATAPAIESLRRHVTQQLSQIEQTEVEELPGERQLGTRPSPPTAQDP